MGKPKGRQFSAAAEPPAGAQGRMDGVYEKNERQLLSLPIFDEAGSSRIDASRSESIASTPRLRQPKTRPPRLDVDVTYRVGASNSWVPDPPSGARSEEVTRILRKHGLDAPLAEMGEASASVRTSSNVKYDRKRPSRLALIPAPRPDQHILKDVRWPEPPLGEKSRVMTDFIREYGVEDSPASLHDVTMDDEYQSCESFDLDEDF